jgi:hypothetical protein
MIRVAANFVRDEINRDKPWKDRQVDGLADLAIQK